MKQLYPIEKVLEESRDKKISKRCKCFILKELFIIDKNTIQEKINTEYMKELLDNKLISDIFTYPAAITQNETSIEIWTEYVEGKSLSHLLTNRLLTLPTLNNIMIKISNAIKYLEAQQAQHMDLHADNILVNGDLIKIIDYGSMIIPGKTMTLGSNVNVIDLIPRESEGYAMYTLIFTSLFIVLFNALKEMNEYFNPGEDSMYDLIKNEYPEYATYFKTILDQMV